MKTEKQDFRTLIYHYHKHINTTHQPQISIFAVRSRIATKRFHFSSMAFLTGFTCSFSALNFSITTC
ncbi:hypothetical protein L596_009985 [Steinernema carpocapsae]|uniref:Uncharacterized protein n=1 Tax=Steinernema carpocapsae TaxID=34508 RepID=A0A4V6A6W8_STECR|nr:hypothetical protein L596_009985 [Steinernema carpocapsae]